MSLTLIGLGLHSEQDLSLRAIETCKNSDKIYIELYTGKWYGDIPRLNELIGKEVVELQRNDLEEDSKKIIEESKSSSVVVLVQGDPLVQTTHSSLVSDARKRGIEIKIIHNASITSAIVESGVHPQKFGPYVTIPFPEKTKGVSPGSIFEIIRENKKRNLHTLCLLDIVADQNRYMTAAEGLGILLNGGVISGDDKAIVYAKAGSDNPTIVYDTVDNLRNIKDVPAVIIILGKLHFTEEEFLSQLK